MHKTIDQMKVWPITDTFTNTLSTGMEELLEKWRVKRHLTGVFDFGVFSRF